jgi:hypothetical protein
VLYKNSVVYNIYRMQFNCGLGGKSKRQVGVYHPVTPLTWGDKEPGTSQALGLNLFTSSPLQLQLQWESSLNLVLVSFLTIVLCFLLIFYHNGRLHRSR